MSSSVGVVLVMVLLLLLLTLGCSNAVRSNPIFGGISVEVSNLTMRLVPDGNVDVDCCKSRLSIE